MRIYLQLLFAFLFFLISTDINAQKFAPKDYYLIDSLDLRTLTADDQILVDSVLRVYHKEKQDTAKLHAINAIIEGSWDDNLWPKYNKWMFDFVKVKLKEKFSTKEEHRLKKFLAGTLNNFGIIALNKGDIKNALNYFLESLAIDREVSGELGTATSLSNIGYIYNSQGNISKALDYYHQSLKIQEKTGDKVGLSRSLNNIGFVYENIGDGAKALEYYVESLEIRKKINDQLGIAVSLYNIAGIYDDKGDVAKALSYYYESLDIYKKIGNQQGVGNALNNIAYIYHTYGDLNCKETRAECLKKGNLIALDFYNQSYELLEKLEDKFGMTTTLNNIGRVYFKLGEITKSKSYSEKAYRYSKELGFPSNIQKSASLLKEISYAEKRYKEAYDYFFEEIKMKDSVDKESNYKQAQQQQAKYTYEKMRAADSLTYAKEKEVKEALIAKQEAEIKVKRNQQFALIGGLLLLVVFAYFMNNRFKVTNNQKKIIENQKFLVEARNKEIMDSINYASHIQEALLPSMESMAEALKNGFVFYKPKDVVAGDFYWMEKFKDSVYFAAADCTGHGVPGAMVSVVCSNALTKALLEEGIENTGKLLDRTREIVISKLAKGGENVKDGMDISLCRLKMERNLDGTAQMQWSGANNPIWIIRKRNYNNVENDHVDSSMQLYQLESSDYDLFEIKGDKESIGKTDNPHAFVAHNIALQKNDSIYIFTDGYADQFGGEKGKKFKYKSLKDLLLVSQDKTMDEQKVILELEFNRWKGNLEQIDDVCLIGVRI